MRVILRPIGVDNWSGLKKYRNCHEDIGSYFTRSGRLYTGLTKQEAEELGEELGEDLSSGSKFWRDFSIRSSGRDVFLDLEDPSDRLKYLFLKNHKRVKSSLLEKKATANFVLINKDEEAKRSNVFNKIKRRSMKEFDKMSAEDIRKCLRIFGHNADRLSNEVAENRLFDFVEGDPKSFLKKWVDNKNRETESIIESAISRNVIRRNKSIYKYGSDVIGRGMIEAIDFLEDPKNQDIKIAIIRQIEGKKSIGAKSYMADESKTDSEDSKSKKSTKSKTESEEEDKSKSKKIRKGDTI